MFPFWLQSDSEALELRRIFGARSQASPVFFPNRYSIPEVKKLLEEQTAHVNYRVWVTAMCSVGSLIVTNALVWWACR